MPSQPSENQEDKTPDKPIPNSQAPIPDTNTPHGGQEANKRGVVTNHESRHNKPQIIDIANIPKIDVVEGVQAIEIARKANTIAEKANTISKSSTIANFCLLVCTVILAAAAIWQYGSANSAAKTAQQTLIETKKFDSTTLANQKVSNRKIDSIDSVKNEREVATFNLQKSGLTAQIKALQQTQKNFEIENQPFLEADDVTVSLFEMGIQMQVQLTVKNVGAFPVQVINVTNGTAIGAVAPTVKSIINIAKANYFPYETYISKESPAIWTYDAQMVDVNKYNSVKNGQFFVWIGGVITYKNLATQKVRYYTFLKKMINNKRATTIVNQNTLGFPK
jgi:hypothetical protein